MEEIESAILVLKQVSGGTFPFWGARWWGWIFDLLPGGSLTPPRCPGAWADTKRRLQAVAYLESALSHVDDLDAVRKRHGLCFGLLRNAVLNG